MYFCALPIKTSVTAMLVGLEWNTGNPGMKLYFDRFISFNTYYVPTSRSAFPSMHFYALSRAHFYALPGVNFYALPGAHFYALPAMHFYALSTAHFYALLAMHFYICTRTFTHLRTPTHFHQRNSRHLHERTFTHFQQRTFTHSNLIYIFAPALLRTPSALLVHFQRNSMHSYALLFLCTPN